MTPALNPPSKVPSGCSRAIRDRLLPPYVLKSPPMSIRPSACKPITYTVASGPFVAPLKATSTTPAPPSSSPIRTKALVRPATAPPAKPKSWTPKKREPSCSALSSSGTAKVCVVCPAVKVNPPFVAR